MGEEDGGREEKEDEDEEDEVEIVAALLFIWWRKAKQEFRPDVFFVHTSLHLSGCDTRMHASSLNRSRGLHARPPAQPGVPGRGLRAVGLPLRAGAQRVERPAAGAVPVTVL